MVILPRVSEPLLTLYRRSVLAALERQFLFDTSFHNEQWSVDLSEGKLIIKLQQDVGEQSWPIQVLGTQATKSSSWLWAWGNKDSGIPSKLLKSANRMRKYGEKHSIPELTTAEQPLNGLTGHFFALVAVGIGTADAYFAAPYDGGIAFLLAVLSAKL
ncbi:hypothetical protein FTUN_6251 [Frigoriglobus tundricola]|uniref:Uncharacterized protein n=2 Tax=Frigoriglobus tundricola TaxID=2774151 RepID=A0A6M5YYY2_9BACT|nr:hypothetical protein FTUN_6251 [Frigoriglobus tundricola]